MYVEPNFKTKKAFKSAIKAGEVVTIFQPGPFGGGVLDCECTVEGPHYPEPHKWYARVKVEAGLVVKVLS